MLKKYRHYYGQSVHMQGKVCRVYLLWSLVILPRLAPPYPWWSEGSPATAPAAHQQASRSSSSTAAREPVSSSSSSTERARSPEPAQTFRTSRGRSRECRSPRAGPAGLWLIPPSNDAPMELLVRGSRKCNTKAYDALAHSHSRSRAQASARR